jgi:3-hydroxybutyrate dehydrogenase
MLKGRCALITGATGGLGRTIALHLAGEGCNIVLNGRVAAGEAEKQRQDLEARYGIRAIYHEADLGDPDAISAMMAASAAAFGAIDVLVNNAVVRHFAPVDAFPVERWTKRSRSTSRPPSTPSATPCPRCARATSAGSSTWGPPTASSAPPAGSTT